MHTIYIILYQKQTEHSVRHIGSYSACPVLKKFDTSAVRERERENVCVCVFILDGKGNRVFDSIALVLSSIDYTCVTWQCIYDKLQ